MCGLLLAYRRSPERLQAALRVMQHRGSDKPTYKSDPLRDTGGWTIGHVRLPIQSSNQEASDQPFRKSGPRFGLCHVGFVGEIFNTLDTGEQEIDLIMEAMSHPEKFHELDGFWAIARLDLRSGRSHLWTDFLGIKPMYYWEEERIVCSEITPMFELAERTPDPDLVYLSNLLKFGYDYSGRTAFSGIRQVAPGTKMEFRSDGELLEETSYWDWSQVPVPEKLDAQNLLELLTRSTLRRVRGVHQDNRVNVNLLLSGGLDSSLVYYILKANLPPGAVSLLHYENSDDAAFLPSGVPFTYLSPRDLGEGGLEEVLRSAVRAMEAPLDLGSLIPQYRLAEALSRLPDSRVVLTGDGADELFGGYTRAALYDSQMSDVFCELPYYHLPRLDRIHMRFTTEVRSPFLSPEVIKFALSLPRGSRIDKAILKDAARLAGVPEAVIQRKKTALKSTQVLTNPLEHRIKLNEVFGDCFY